MASGTVQGKPVQVMQCRVEQFMEQCVVAYTDACGEPDMKLRKLETPFLTSPEGGMHPFPLKRG